MTEANFTLHPMTEADADAIAAIFGYFILHSFAAYHSTPITGDGIAEMIRAHPKEYPCYVVEVDGNVVGFGELRPIHRGEPSTPR